MLPRAAVAAPILLFGALAATPLLASIPCTVTQLTHSAGDTYNQISATPDGHKIVYVHALPNYTEFRVEVANADTGATTTLVVEHTGYLTPKISVDGNWVAFSSADDLTGENRDYSREIFLEYLPTLDLQQLTHAVGATLWSPRLAPDLSRVGFFSPNDLTGGNPDGTSEFFLFNRGNGQIYQITNSTEGLSGFYIEPTFGKFVWGEHSDFFGTNPDHNCEVFYRDRVTGAFQQWTQTSGGGNYPVGLNTASNRMLFHSDAPEYVGEWGGVQLIVRDLATGAQRILTPWAIQYPSGTWMSDDGHRVAFGADCAIIIADADSGESATLFGDHPPPCATDAYPMSSDGSRFFVSSDDDPTGGNSDHNRELFRIDCPLGILADGFESGDTSAWSAVGP